MNLKEYVCLQHCLAAGLEDGLEQLERDRAEHDLLEAGVVLAVQPGQNQEVLRISTYT